MDFFTALFGRRSAYLRIPCTFRRRRAGTAAAGFRRRSRLKRGMGMKGRRTAGLLLLAAVLLCSLGLAGCSGKSAAESARRTEDGRVILRVSMYNSSSYPVWRSYVENHCPDVFIQWENNRNTAANVLYLAEHGKMPDLVSIRRFECDTAAKLRPYLADLSGLTITASYEKRYLEPFAYGGKQYWLPGPGVIDGIVANTDLFSQYGIPLPTDLASFIDACARLESRDVAVFAADCAEPWSPTQMIEGFGASALAGSAWVQEFESGRADAVDPGVFFQVAPVLRLLHKNGILTQEDLDSSAAQTNELLIGEKAAMVRKASDEKFDAASSHHYAALPFFGKTAADNWLCTYPVFSLALSKELEEDPKLLAAGEEVLSVMFSKGAQQALNESGEGLISYNGVDLPLSDAIQNVKGLIDGGRCFIRVLNSNSFSANTLALTALIRDEASDQELLEILNENLFRKPDAAQVAHSAIEADSALDSDLCCPSASVVAQVLQRETGTDCAVIDVRETPTAIFRGDYSDADVNAVVLSSKVYTGSVDREQLTELLDTCVLCATTFQSGQVEPVIEYPAVSGLLVGMRSDGTITSVRPEGKNAADRDTYRIAVSGNIYAALAHQNSPLTELFAQAKQTLKQYFMEGFRSAEGLPEPKHYYSVG